MKFSVIVPVYNTGRSLQRCIEALQLLDYPKEDYEILMIDNNSTDNSSEILTAAKGIHVMHESKQGSYAARNHALREARGSLLAFTDSDCLPDPSWLKEIEALFQDPDTHIVLGHVKPARNSGRLIRMIAHYGHEKAKLVFNSSCPDVYFGHTNNMGVRRATLDSYGPFLERPRGADTIFVRRVVNGEGCSAVAYASKACVEHDELNSIFSFYKKMFIYGRSSKSYHHIVRARPLSIGERISAMKACLRQGHYPFYMMILFVLMMCGGMAAWTLGSLSVNPLNVDALSGKNEK